MWGYDLGSGATSGQLERDLDSFVHFAFRACEGDSEDRGEQCQPDRDVSPAPLLEGVDAQSER